MSMIEIDKVREKTESKLDERILKDEYLTDEDEAFFEFHKANQDEYRGRAKFNGKLIVILSIIILFIFFIIYMCSTSISDVVKKNTGESVVSEESKMFIIDVFTY